MSIKTMQHSPIRYPNRTTQIFDFVLEYKIDHNGNSPTVREICAAVGINSTSNASYHLDILEAQGKIRRSFDRSRSIEVIGGKWIPPEKGE